jgi:hypothetical protein
VPPSKQPQILISGRVIQSLGTGEYVVTLLCPTVSAQPMQCLGAQIQVTEPRVESGVRYELGNPVASEEQSGMLPVWRRVVDNVDETIERKELGLMTATRSVIHGIAEGTGESSRYSLLIGPCSHHNPDRRRVSQPSQTV